MYFHFKTNLKHMLTNVTNLFITFSSNDQLNDTYQTPTLSHSKLFSTTTQQHTSSLSTFVSDTTEHFELSTQTSHTLL